MALPGAWAAACSSSLSNEACPSAAARQVESRTALSLILCFMQQPAPLDPLSSHTLPAAASPAKSRGALRLCSSLLRVFFRLNALALANPIFTMLKALEGVQFPKADEVTLRYYEGRFAVFEEKYVSARLAFTVWLCCCQ